MTRSYGGDPNRPQQQHEQSPELKAAAPEVAGWEGKLDSLSRRPQDEHALIQPVRVDFGKRFVAGIIDLFAAYLAGMIVAVVPFVNDVLTPQLTMTLLLLARDGLFEGRGIGKNLMGLQVVGVKTGAPCTLMQSVKRNGVIFGPLLVLYIVTGVLRVIGMFHIHGVPPLSDSVLSIINTACFLVVLVAIPYETHQAYNRPDGRRFGDRFSGTAIVEAPMDFSKPF